jgi:hypothetical protein
MATDDQNHGATQEPATLELATGCAKLSLDTWAVIFALTAAALIRAGIVKHIPW